MKKYFILVSIVAVVAFASLFLINGCQQAANVPGPVISTLNIIDSTGIISSGSTTNSRVLTIYGTLEDTSITTLEMTVNSVAMKVPVNSGLFSQGVSLVRGLNTIIVSVSNAAGGTTISTLTVTANIVPYGIRAQLTWDTYSDMDLHFNQAVGTMEDSTDCYYSNKAPNWDGTGSNIPGSDVILYPGNPVLDVDNVTAYGPENTVLETPVSGQSYWVRVRAYSGTATPTVRIYINDVLAKTYVASQQLTGIGLERVWRVCNIAWSGTTGAVTDVDTYGTSSLKTTGHK